MLQRKHLLWCIFLLLLALAVSAAVLWAEKKADAEPKAPKSGAVTEEKYFVADRQGEIRAVWVNYNELSALCRAGTEESFRQGAQEMMQNLADDGMNTVILQVRPFCDAFYPSEYFPWSAYLTGTQGRAVPFDPLQILIDCAKAEKLFTEAWINPYRVSQDTNWEKLSADNPAKLWHMQQHDERLIVCEAGIYFNPCSAEVRRLIVSGARELVEKYAVDAIHMDDYFYPTTAEKIDRAQYAAYCADGGTLSLADFRRAQVNSLLSEMYAAVKAADPKTLLVLSPGGNIEYDFDTLYADVKRWGSQSGYCDVLMPQIYYGFENRQRPFEETARAWAGLCKNPKVRLCYGLAAYKCGVPDACGKSERAEFMKKGDVLARQLAFCRGLPKYDGAAFYGYTNIYRKKENQIMQKEWKNLKSMLQYSRKERKRHEG